MLSVQNFIVQLFGHRISMNSSMQSSFHSSAKMKILSFFLVITLMLSFSAIPEVSARANQGSSAKGMLTTSPQLSKFPVCIDDSDCLKLAQGHKFACFKFLCYPWKDDSIVADKDKIQLCRKNADCGDSKTCYRHDDIRSVPKGLCFDELRECGLDITKECPKGQGCCGSYCCEDKYYKQYSNLPCTNHIGCQDLQLGDFCCPAAKGQTDKTCCNVNPNPPVTDATTSDRGRAMSLTATAFTSSVISMGFFFLLI